MHTPRPEEAANHAAPCIALHCMSLSQHPWLAVGGQDTCLLHACPFICVRAARRLPLALVLQLRLLLLLLLGCSQGRCAALARRVRPLAFIFISTSCLAHAMSSSSRHLCVLML